MAAVAWRPKKSGWRRILQFFPRGKEITFCARHMVDIDIDYALRRNMRRDGWGRGKSKVRRASLNWTTSGEILPFMCCLTDRTIHADALQLVLVYRPGVVKEP